MLKKIIFSLVLLGVNCVCASQFDNEWNHFSGNRLERLKVCGERCSGTDFVWHLLHGNFHQLQVVSSTDYVQKHCLWWFGTPSGLDNLDSLHLNSFYIDFLDDCLIVVVIRDPYDWLRSYYHYQWCVPKSLWNNAFHDFVSREWIPTIKPLEDRKGDYSNIDFWHPSFRNILELRKGKTENYLELGHRVGNYLFVRYEDVRDNPEEFIEYVGNYFALQKTPSFDEVDTHMASHVPYVPKHYFSIASEDLQFINQEIDWELENKVGYFKRNEVQ